MNYLSSNINKKIGKYHNNKILLNIPSSNNKINQKIFSFYSYSSSTEKFNNKRIKYNKLNNNP